jgi:short-subunit dehydrogenase
MQRELEVNYLAPAELMRRMVPGMVRRGRGRVVVIGSLTSFVPFPGNASYSASKSALLALVRSIRVELQGTGVHFGVVLPGYTRTAMTEGRSSYLPAMLPEEVADAVALCYERERRLVVPGALNRAAARVFSMFPETSDRLLTRLARFVIPSPT